MKRKFILACILALFPIGITMMAFSWPLAQMLGYYLLLIDGIFGLVAVALVRWYKRTEEVEQ